MVNRKKAHEIMKDSLQEIKMKDENVLKEHAKIQREVAIMEVKIVYLNAMISKISDLKKKQKALELEKAEYDERKFLEHEGKKSANEGLMSLVEQRR